MNAAQIAVDEINEAGGINGYQVDSKQKMTRAMQRNLSMLITL